MEKGSFRILTHYHETYYFYSTMYQKAKGECAGDYSSQQFIMYVIKKFEISQPQKMADTERGGSAH